MAKGLSKTQKRLDNNIRSTLHHLCENTLKDIEGFQWLTHQAEYSNFPASLIVTCVFAEREHLEQITTEGMDEQVRSLIQRALFKIGVKIPAPLFQIRWDSEQACTEEHDGHWKHRLQAREGLAVARNRPH